jgi:hypothetical protein
MDISLFMSASRPKWWERMYESLEGNKCEWEIIAVGPNKPKWHLPYNFRYLRMNYKPCQCYAIASWMCRGKLIGWTTDDATYDSNSLDLIMQAYLSDSMKTIYAQQSIEDGKDTRNDHFFFWGCPDTPRMAPLAFINREWFWRLGGYDRNFVCGQAENDIVMRALEDGGQVKLISDSRIYIHHKEVHRFRWNYPFRSGYYNDRQYLEECWCPDGFGTFNEKTLKHGTISPVRLLPLHPFNYKNILTVAQGNKGRWA